MNHYLSTIFCDDIRQEVGGKLSLIGVYNGVMIVPAFPMKLPKLCIVSTLVISADDPPKMIMIRVWKDSEPIAVLNATDDYLKQIATAREPVAQIPIGSLRVNSSVAQICFEQLEFEKPSLVRVSALTEAGEIRSAGLQIVRQTDITDD